MRAKNRTERKNKGQLALFFPKWHYTIANNPKRPQRQASPKHGGNFK